MIQHVLPADAQIVIALPAGFTPLARALALRETKWSFAQTYAPMHQLEETRFLIEAVAATPPRDAVLAAKIRARPIEDRVVWVIDLFSRLERRDRLQRTASFR